MNKYKIHHSKESKEGFIYLAKISRYDALLQKYGFSRSNDLKDYANFFSRIENELVALPFLNRVATRELVQKLALQNNFRSLEFRPSFVQIQTGASAAEVEPLLSALTSSLTFSEIHSTSDRSLIEEQNLKVSKRFDLYSPAHWLINFAGTLAFSLGLMMTSFWLSGALVDPMRTLTLFLVINFFIVMSGTYFLRRRIRNLYLPARAFVIHAVSTLLLLCICGAGFEIFANSTFDSSEPQEYAAAIIAKDENLKIEFRPPGPRAPMKFEVNENQFARIVVGQSREILNIHRGFFRQPWLSRQRLEY